MGVFVCDECNCIENTALGHFWGIGTVDFKEESKNGKALCSECMPTTYSDGSPTRRGEWHNKFPKKKWDGVRKMMNR